jgi:hypothetical protein
VWWLVTPGNPLKDTRGLAPLTQRIAAARALAQHPRIDVTGIEAEIGARYTYDTMRYLFARCPGVRFVWIMGADNLRGFSRWQRWRGIAAMVPIAVIDRLGPSLYATAGLAAQALGPPPPGLDLPPWPQVTPVVHRVAGRARAIAGGPQLRPAARNGAMVMNETQKSHKINVAQPSKVETVDPPCLC